MRLHGHLLGDRDTVAEMAEVTSIHTNFKSIFLSHNRQREGLNKTTYVHNTHQGNSDIVTIVIDD